MPVDMEQLVRESLQVRAHDVAPDPRTWDRIQTRLRRRQIAWWALAGVTAAAALIVGAWFVPSVVERANVEFAPFDDPPAVAPSGEPTSRASGQETATREPSTAPDAGTEQPSAPLDVGGFVATDGFSIVTLSATGEVTRTLLEGAEPDCPPEGECEPSRIQGLAVRPGSTPDELTVAYWRAFECAGDLEYLRLRDDGSVDRGMIAAQGNDCHSPPVWSPDGSHLAWTSSVYASDGETMLWAVGWDNEGQTRFSGRFPTGSGPLFLPEALDWVWTEGLQPETAGFVAVRGLQAGQVETFRIPVQRTEGVIGTSGTREPLAPDESGSTLAYANSHANDGAAAGPEFFLQASVDGDGTARQPRVVRAGDGGQSDVVAAPDAVIADRVPNGSASWLAARGDVVLAGDGFERVWGFTWGDDFVELEGGYSHIAFLGAGPAGSSGGQTDGAQAGPAPQSDPRPPASAAPTPSPQDGLPAAVAEAGQAIYGQGAWRFSVAGD